MMVLPAKKNPFKSKKGLTLASLGDDPLAASLSCEFGPDGIQFKGANIQVTKNGMAKVTEDQLLPLSIVGADDVEYGAEIGRGASAVVQEGIYKPENIPIAIKTINLYDKDKRHQVVNDLKNFLQDRIEHVKGNYTEFCAHIVQVYGAYYDEGSIKIIMELMDAGSLRSILNMAKKAKESPPYTDECYLANITYQMLSGLDYIHKKKKQIHRDIKPENVLINSLGQVKLTDFGISKQLEQTHAFSKTFVGTAGYMSPERLLGQHYAYSSDMWSLGLLLIEMATGEYPYKKAKSLVETLENITTAPEANLPDNGLYSVEFQDFLTKCLNKDPSKRGTASSLLEHPWLLKNSELNYDLSEWVSNLLFTCKYGYTPEVEEELMIIEEEPHLNGQFEEEEIQEEIKEDDMPDYNAKKSNRMKLYYDNNEQNDNFLNQTNFFGQMPPINQNFNAFGNNNKILDENDIEIENLE